MLKFIQKSLVICSASLGISGLACANDGWEYDSNGRYDMFSSKNHARADMLERKEAQASKAKTAQYEPYRHPLNGNPYGPPVYIPAASYHGTPSSSDTIAPRQQGRINEPHKYYDSEAIMSWAKRRELGGQQIDMHGMINDMNQKPIENFAAALRYFEQETLQSLPPEEQVEWKQFVAEARAVNEAGNGGKHHW
jgi:hypothetical protein